MTPETLALVHAGVLEYFGPDRGQRILDQVAARYPAGLPLEHYANALLREAARLRDGDTGRWDTAARAAGLTVAAYELAGGAA